MTWPLVVILATLAFGGLYAFYAREVLKQAFRWFVGQLVPDPQAPKAKLVDIVTYSGLAIAVIAFLIGWFTLKWQNQEARLQIQTKDLTDSIATLDVERRAAESGARPDFAPDVDIHLESPTRDIALIRKSPPELSWQYAKHTPQVNYVIELVQRSSTRPDGPEQPLNSCDFSKSRTCRFYATQPSAQRSDIPATTLAGSFLWRVVPAKARNTDLTNPGLDFSPMSEWSEYEPFSVYPSLHDRIQISKKILIGTTYSDNVHFSSVDGHGHHSGYDIDLVRLLVDRCLTSDLLHPDASKCYSEALKFAASGNSDLEDPKNGEIRTYPSIQDGLDAVMNGEIDLFVGAVTKTPAREKNGLRFTNGYYPFETRLYGRVQRPPVTRGWFSKPRTYIRRWIAGDDQAQRAIEPRRLGVVQKSTNDWLAHELVKDKSFGDKLTVIAFPDYDSLKNAFFRRKLDGAILDSDLGTDLVEGECDVQIIEGLKETKAWSEYQRQLQSDHEEFAVAVAVKSDNHASCSGFLGSIGCWFKIGAPYPDDSASLYSALNNALGVLQKPDGSLISELNDALKRNFPRSLDSCEQKTSP